MSILRKLNFLVKNELNVQPLNVHSGFVAVEKFFKESKARKRYYKLASNN